MKYARKCLFAVLFVFSLSLLCSRAFAGNRLERILKEGKVVVCCEPYFAPFAFIDNTKTGQDQFRGSDMELARYVAKRLGVELEIVGLSWDAVLAGIAQGKYDLALGGMAYTPQRAKNLELSDIYISSNEGHSIIVRKENADKYNSFDDFDGKVVGYHSGTLQEQLVKQQLPKANKKVFDSIQNAVLAVDAGKVDGVAVSVLNGDMFVASHPDLVVLPLRFTLEKQGDVIAATKGEVELIEKVNGFIAEVKEQNLYPGWQNAAKAEAEKLGLK